MDMIARARQLAISMNCEFAVTSAKDNYNVKETFEAITRAIME